MTIPDEAVRAAQEATEGGFGITDDYMRLALTAALPFLQGVKVKALEWEKADDGIRDRAQTVVGWYFISNPKEGQYNLLFDNEEMTALFAIYDNLEAAKAAAQADYEARILSAIEGVDCIDPLSSPSPRAQALEESERITSAVVLAVDALLAARKRLASIDPNWEQGHLFPLALEALNAAPAAIRALSSQPVEDGVDSIEVTPSSGCVFADMGVERPVSDGWLPVTTGLNAIGYEIGGGYILKLSYANLSQFEAAKEAIQSHLPASPGASE